MESYLANEVTIFGNFDTSINQTFFNEPNESTSDRLEKKN